jgi:5-methylcytosine-specific restriction endonuclease McrA
VSPGRACLTCGRIIPHGQRCPDCGKTKARGYGSDWEKVRRQILERDGYRCRLQLAGCTGTATQVDHIAAVAIGGQRLDPANLQSSCAGCNSRKRHLDAAERAQSHAKKSVWPMSER